MDLVNTLNTLPDSLKQNESIVKLLELYSSTTTYQNEFIKDPLKALDTDFLISIYEKTQDENFNNIRKELFKIYLEEIYTVFENLSSSELVYNKFKAVYETLNLDTSNLKIAAEIDKSINAEYLNAERIFKSKKGTKAGFFFVYDIINKAGIQSLNSDAFFNLIEGTLENPDEPFQYTVQTSLYKEVYEETVLPLAHPIGFDWHFIRLLFLNLTDYFGIKETSTLEELILACYDNNNNISSQNILETGVYGELKSFYTSTDQDNKESVQVDFYPKDGSTNNGIRLIREYNGRILVYDRELEQEMDNSTVYLDISSIELRNSQDGFLEVTTVDRGDYTAIQSIQYKEYSIINKDYLEVYYSIKGDKEVKYKSKIKLENKVIDPDDKKFFTTVSFDRLDVFSNSKDYNGRIIEDKGYNCKLNYKRTFSYEVTTLDDTELVQQVRANQSTLAKNVNDIVVPPDTEDTEQYIKEHYSNADHALEDTHSKLGMDNFARLAFGSLPTEYLPYRSENWELDDDTELDSDELRINFSELNPSDKGFNTTLNRYEMFYVPDLRSTLDKIAPDRSIGVQHFIRINTETTETYSGNYPSYFGLGYLPSTEEEKEDLKEQIKEIFTMPVVRANGDYTAWELTYENHEYKFSNQVTSNTEYIPGHELDSGIELDSEGFYLDVQKVIVNYYNTDVYGESIDGEPTFTDFSDSTFSAGVYRKNRSGDWVLLEDNNIDKY